MDWIADQPGGPALSAGHVDRLDGGEEDRTWPTLALCLGSGPDPPPPPLTPLIPPRSGLTSVTCSQFSSGLPLPSPLPPCRPPLLTSGTCSQFSSGSMTGASSATLWPCTASKRETG